MYEFTGDFETHLTVLAEPGASAGSGNGGDSDTASEDLAAWAERHGLAYLRILLDQGSTPDQPMLTYRGRGTLTEQRAGAAAWTERLRADGFTVARVKIEAAPWNAEVPQTSAEAAHLPAGHHFEHHVKVLLTDAAQPAAVRTLGERHAAHLSRNARRVLAEGRQERFLTQRCHGVGRSEARRRLEALLTALADAGHPVVDVEEEFVVYDDNPSVDAGWLDRPVR
jgi:hypothetical protein